MILPVRPQKPSIEYDAGWQLITKEKSTKDDFKE